MRQIPHFLFSTQTRQNNIKWLCRIARNHEANINYITYSPTRNINITIMYMAFCSFLLNATLSLPVFIGFNIVSFQNTLEVIWGTVLMFYFLLVCEEFPFIIWKQILFGVLDLRYVDHVIEEKESWWWSISSESKAAVSYM